MTATMLIERMKTEPRLKVRSESRLLSGRRVAVREKVMSCPQIRLFCLARRAIQLNVSSSARLMTELKSPIAAE